MDKRAGGVKEEIFSGHKKRIDGKNMENLEIFINIPFVAGTTDRQTKFIFYFNSKKIHQSILNVIREIYITDGRTEEPSLITFINILYSFFIY